MKRRQKTWWQRLGPGIITGASDDDPAGIATYSQTGAKFGYGLLWLAPFTLPLMFAVQEMSARIAMVTGQGLAAVMRRTMRQRKVATIAIVFFAANVVNIGANLGAMAEAIQLILPGPFWLWLIVTAGGILTLEFFTSYRTYIKILRWLILVLFAYVITAFLTEQQWTTIVRDTFIPTIPAGVGVWGMIVAVLGTTISPYLLFWQASEEVEEEIANGRDLSGERRGVTVSELRDMRIDVMTGMGMSNLIMFFIMVTTAGTLFAAGISDIQDASQAAAALRPLAGDGAFLLFTLGIIGTGLIGVPVLATSASFAMAEAFRWPEGLEKTFRQARGFHISILAAIGLGVLTNMIGISTIDFLIGSAILNGLLAPFVLWHVIRLADRTDVVGQHRSPRLIRWLGWLTFALMVAAGSMLAIEML